MPLTRSVTAPQSCLRCQLRQVVFRTGKSTASPCFSRRANEYCRALTTSIRRSQEIEDQEDGAFLKSNNRDDKRRAIYRREYPLGRIVGQPGRRQRECSETLKIDSMKRPFDVVLLQDVRESKEQEAPAGNEAAQESSGSSAISPAQLASELLKQDETPNQDEVDESIDALRPSTSIVDRHQYNSILRQLSDGYNTQQLSSYLMKSSRLSSVGEDDVHVIREDSVRGKGSLQRSSWRPGRTPIEKRHSTSIVLKKSEFGSNKKRITEQILRLAWNLTIHSEEQQIGELEMLLQSWQIQYLFDRRRNNKPNFEHVIQPPLLLRNSEVLPYRPDRVVRITARRRDAEEIAGLVESELREVGKLELDLSAFKPMLSQPEWPKSLGKILPESDLNYVGQHTTNVIERKDERTVCIYNRSETVRQHGKRLLLSLLDLPSPRSIAILDIRAARNGNEEAVNGRDSVLLPENAGSSLHFRYRSLPFSRLTIPIYRSTNDIRCTTDRDLQSKVQQDQNRTTIAAHLADTVDLVKTFQPSRPHRASTSLEPPDLPKDDPFNRDSGSYWEIMPDLDVLPLEVQFCKILQAPGGAQDGHAARKPTYPTRRFLKDKSVISAVQPEVPAVYTLLSYFSPREQNLYAFDNSPRPPYLIAHFFPSPFTAGGVDAMRNLPRLEFWYDSDSKQDTAQSTDSRALHLSHVKTILYQQELQIPLPAEAVDLRIMRKASLTGKLDRILADEEIMQFTETLRQSASSGSGVLAGQPAIKMKLPLWVAQRNEAQQRAPHEHVEVEYFFERFEQVQKAAFVPIQPDGFTGSVDPAMKQVLDGLPDSSFLEYKVVEGGVIGGSRAELSLKYDEGTVSSVVGSARSDDQNNEEVMKRRDLQLVETALGLVTSLTRINAGELPQSDV